MLPTTVLVVLLLMFTIQEARPPGVRPPEHRISAADQIYRTHAAKNRRIIGVCAAEVNGTSSGACEGQVSPRAVIEIARSAVCLPLPYTSFPVKLPFSIHV